MGEVSQVITCPSCSKVILQSAKACVHCGMSLLSEPKDAGKAPRPPQPEPDRSPGVGVVSPTVLSDEELRERISKCPICHRADVRRVSGIHATGTWDNELSGPTASIGEFGGHLGVSVGTASLSGQSATGLAQRLAPPGVARPPAAPQSYVGCIGCAGLIAGVMLFGSIVGLVSPANPDNPGDRGAAAAMLVFSAFAAIACYVAYQPQKQAREGALARYNADLDRARNSQSGQRRIWERLYYCRSCDCVFDPLTLVFATSDQMETLYSRIF